MHQRIFRATALAIAVTGLAGCVNTATPLSKNFDQADQYKVRSAQHWNVISADVMNRTLAALQAAGATAGAPVYVATPENAGTFETAFRDMITTRLVEGGASVQAHPVPGQYTVVYHTQVVRHASNMGYYNGGRDFQNLGDGVTVRYGQHNVEAVPAYGPVSAYSGQTGTEMVLTTAVLHQDKFLSRTTDVYYLENVDAGLFQSSFKNIKMKVVNQ